MDKLSDSVIAIDTKIYNSALRTSSLFFTEEPAGDYLYVGGLDTPIEYGKDGKLFVRLKYRNLTTGNIVSLTSFDFGKFFMPKSDDDDTLIPCHHEVAETVKLGVYEQMRVIKSIDDTTAQGVIKFSNHDYNGFDQYIADSDVVKADYEAEKITNVSRGHKMKKLRDVLYATGTIDGAVPLQNLVVTRSPVVLMPTESN